MSRPKGSLNKNTLAKLTLAPPLPIEPEVPETDSQIRARLEKTFSVFGKVVENVVAGKVRSVIISGATGCGKTYESEKILDDGLMKGVIDLERLKGTSSPIALYQSLYRSHEPGSVLLIDDCDDVFYELDALNNLKVALDTSRQRWVSWNKESKILEAREIPNSFQFEGSAMFCSNVNFTREIERGNKLAPHLRALIDRCRYIDLGIHSRREILVRIGMVLEKEEFIEENRISQKNLKIIKSWLCENFTRVRSLSIRTAVQLGEEIASDPEGWADNVEVLLCQH